MPTRIFSQNKTYIHLLRRFQWFLYKTNFVMHRIGSSSSHVRSIQSWSQWKPTTVDTLA